VAGAALAGNSFGHAPATNPITIPGFSRRPQTDRDRLRTQQLRQLVDVRSDPPGPVAGKQLGRLAPSRLILEIDIGQRLPVGVADDEAGVGFLDGLGRRLALKAPHQ
jgi:hypothetical protein